MDDMLGGQHCRTGRLIGLALTLYVSIMTTAAITEFCIPTQKINRKVPFQHTPNLLEFSLPVFHSFR